MGEGLFDQVQVISMGATLEHMGYIKSGAPLYFTLYHSTPFSNFNKDDNYHEYSHYFDDVNSHEGFVDEN